MKISKLFHWLYGLLMLLPIFAVGISCLYVVLNENSYRQYENITEDISYTSITYTYETNEVDNSDSTTIKNSLVSGHIYKFSFIIHTIRESFDLYTDTGIDNILVSYDLSNVRIDTDAILPYTFDYFSIGYNTQNRHVMINMDNASDDFACEMTFYSDRATCDFYCVINDVDNIYIDDTFFSVSACPQDKIPYTTTTETISYPKDIESVFYEELDKINDVEIFSWAKYSFLATPITYITGLFGIASTSPIITLLSYWLTISIVWLVFDLIMYVPLLVHRWIDKGVVE